jgi:hypothetical protein
MNIVFFLRARLLWSIASEPLPDAMLDLLGDLHWSGVFQRDGEASALNR